MARPARIGTLVGHRDRGTKQARSSTTSSPQSATATGYGAAERPGCISGAFGHHGPAKGEKTIRRPAEGEMLAIQPRPEPAAEPPGVLVYKPPPKRAQPAATYPRFIRQLSPNVERLVQPDPITGKWPRLPNLSHAEVDARDPSTREPGLREWELRCTVDWGDRPPSRTAFADWLAASTPAIEEAYAEKAEREAAARASRPFEEAAE
jgi:hypothetical protein